MDDKLLNKFKNKDISPVVLIETPPETHVETHVETPVETPPETQVETPPETPGETPVETHVETFAETSPKTPIENLVENPIENPVDILIKAIAKTKIRKYLIYIHICTLNNWATVLYKLLNIIEESGLGYIIHEIRLGILGDDTLVMDFIKKDFIELYSKCHLIFHSNDKSLYERPTLEHIRESSEKELFNVLYLHTKGIRDKNQKLENNINDWTTMMLYFLVYQYKNCTSLLENHSSVGCNLFNRIGAELLKKQATTSNEKHYSGNFWWATSEHILKLPKKIGPGYLDPELWIGDGPNIVLHSVHQPKNNNLYFKPYPSENYRDTTKIIATPIIKWKYYIYFHICTINNWETIVKKLYHKIVESGLINIIEKIKITVLGDADKVIKLLNEPKVEIIFNSTDNKIYERKCLLLLREHALKEDFKVLYIHSKGITPRANKQSVHEWTDLMIYFVITKYYKCIEKLNEYDTCGINIEKINSSDVRNISPLIGSTDHYSGNFWWSKSCYIKLLPDTIGPKYLDPEFWITNCKKKKMFSFWQSNVCHYKVNYPAILYENKEQEFTVKL